MFRNAAPISFTQQKTKIQQNLIILKFDFKECQLRIKLYDDFSFPILNIFPFLCTNIQTVSAFIL